MDGFTKLTMLSYHANFIQAISWGVLVQVKLYSKP